TRRRARRHRHPPRDDDASAAGDGGPCRSRHFRQHHQAVDRTRGCARLEGGSRPSACCCSLRSAGLPARASCATVSGNYELWVRMIMCRNIRTLYNFEPPATDEEIYLSSLQFVRKLSGFSRPSQANQAAFDRPVDNVSRAARELIDSLVTSAPPP